jgi:hypothetical protein
MLYNFSFELHLEAIGLRVFYTTNAKLASEGVHSLALGFFCAMRVHTF